MNATLKVIVVIAGAALSPASLAQGKGPLPVSALMEICQRHEGKPAVVLPDKTLTINCPWVERMLANESDTLVDVYRAVLASARTVSGLRPAILPSDLSCGAEVAGTGGRKVRCKSDMMGESVPFDFVADAQGRLLRVEMAFNYKKIYTATMQAKVSEGKIRQFFPAYVDLHVDMLMARLHHSASAADSVKKDGDVVKLVVAAPAN